MSIQRELLSEHAIRPLYCESIGAGLQIGVHGIHLDVLHGFWRIWCDYLMYPACALVGTVFYVQSRVEGEIVCHVLYSQGEDEDLLK